MNEKKQAKQESCKSCGLKPTSKKAAIIILALLAVGLFYLFSNQTQSPPNLKLLTSHSSPQTGEEWVVSFETTGTSDLTITPEDTDTIDDLDLPVLKCNEEEKTPQVLGGNVIFYSGWRCLGKGELTHLVNIARKHALKFQFEDKIAYAYNNPDSVTDTFSDESKIAATSSMVVTGGQVKLVELKDNGESCSSGGECSSTFCVDDVCCNSACDDQPECQTCGTYSSAEIGTCGYVNDSGQDPRSECTQGSSSSDGCRSNNCSGADYACGVQGSGDGGCPVCGKCSDADEACENHTANTYDSGCSQCKGCSGSEIGTCSTNQTTNWGAATYGCGTANEDKRCYVISGTAYCRDCSDTSGYFYSDGCTCVSFRSAENKVCWRRGSASQTCTTACGSYGGCVSANWDDNASCSVCKNWDSGADCASSASTSAPYYDNPLSWDTGHCLNRSVTSPSCSGKVSVLEQRLCVCQY